jgi:hypothetical protein
VPKIRVQDMRLSFIWVETALDRLGSQPPAGAPYAFLGRRFSYAERFDQVKKGADEAGLEPPWRQAGKQFFWTYYLEGRPPGDANGDLAWKGLVPFRKKIAVQAQPPWPEARMTQEAFFYPHGLAWVLTVRFSGDLDLKQAVKKAFEVRRTGKFAVKWNAAEAEELLSLDKWAEKMVADLRQAAWGAQSPAGIPSATPFSVVTVVQGSGVKPDLPALQSDKLVQRALEALTAWRPTWEHDELAGLPEPSLHIRPAPASHILYGRSRGRAVWFPALFATGAGDFHSLACYHRNLVLVSLQVESLGRLAAETAKLIRAGTALSAPQNDCARRAAGILGRLYAGDPSTYRSWSPRAQIDQNDLIADIDEVRTFFGMPTL